MRFFKYVFCALLLVASSPLYAQVEDENLFLVPFMQNQPIHLNWKNDLGIERSDLMSCESENELAQWLKMCEAVYGSFENELIFYFENKEFDRDSGSLQPRGYIEPRARIALQLKQRKIHVEFVPLNPISIGDNYKNSNIVVVKQDKKLLCGDENKQTAKFVYRQSWMLYPEDVFYHVEYPGSEFLIKSDARFFRLVCNIKYFDGHFLFSKDFVYKQNSVPSGVDSLNPVLEKDSDLIDADKHNDKAEDSSTENSAGIFVEGPKFIYMNEFEGKAEYKIIREPGGNLKIDNKLCEFASEFIECKVVASDAGLDNLTLFLKVKSLEKSENPLSGNIIINYIDGGKTKKMVFGVVAVSSKTSIYVDKESSLALPRVKKNRLVCEFKEKNERFIVGTYWYKNGVLLKIADNLKSIRAVLSETLSETFTCVIIYVFKKSLFVADASFFSAGKQPMFKYFPTSILAVADESLIYNMEIKGNNEGALEVKCFLLDKYSLPILGNICQFTDNKKISLKIAKEVLLNFVVDNGTYIKSLSKNAKIRVVVKTKNLTTFADIGLVVTKINHAPKITNSFIYPVNNFISGCLFGVLDVDLNHISARLRFLEDPQRTSYFSTIEREGYNLFNKYKQNPAASGLIGLSNTVSPNVVPGCKVLASDGILFSSAIARRAKSFKYASDLVNKSNGTEAELVSGSLLKLPQLPPFALSKSKYPKFLLQGHASQIVEINKKIKSISEVSLFNHKSILTTYDGDNGIRVFIASEGIL